MSGCVTSEPGSVGSVTSGVGCGVLSGCGVTSGVVVSSGVVVGSGATVTSGVASGVGVTSGISVASGVGVTSGFRELTRTVTFLVTVSLSSSQPFSLL